MKKCKSSKFRDQRQSYVVVVMKMCGCQPEESGNMGVGRVLYPIAARSSASVIQITKAMVDKSLNRYVWHRDVTPS